MKKLYTLALAYIFVSIISLSSAQTTTYGKTLFRVNSGGGGTPPSATDTTTLGWGTDTQLNKSPYITDADTVGTKTFGILDPIDITHPSVPTYADQGIFQNERDIYNPAKPNISYNFPLAPGTKVEIKLYFAELYLTAAGQRIMDVEVEGAVLVNNLDIFAEAGGAKKGLVKTVAATVGGDGNLDIDFVRVSSQSPIINAIEIFQLKDVVIQGIFNKNATITLSAYPNPFKEEVSIELDQIKPSDVTVFDSYGKAVIGASEIQGNKVSINLTSYPNGAYFVKISDQQYQSQTIRLIKQ
jgi:hypothetical protein